MELNHNAPIEFKNLTILLLGFENWMIHQVAFVTLLCDIENAAQEKT